MKDFWNWQHEVGEMLGTTMMVFAIMMAILLTKKKSFGIDTTFKKRMFMGTMAAMAVLIGAISAIGFGGLGMINPAVVLIAGGLDGEWAEVPAIIGFQAIGALLGAVLLIAFAEMFVKDVKLSDAFGFINQSPQKTAAMELFGNIFWLIPIGAILVVMINGHHDPSGVLMAIPNTGTAPAKQAVVQAIHPGNVERGFGHFEVVVVAIAGKFILVAGFDEFGAAAFNGNAWFARIVIATYANRKFPIKAALPEMTAVSTSLALGVGVGFFSHIFIK